MADAASKSLRVDSGCLFSQNHRHLPVDVHDWPEGRVA